MIRMLLHFLFVLHGILAIMVLVQAQDQSGFISIDCGLPENSSYTDSTIGINYISDAKFIDSGVTKSLSPSERSTQPPRFWNVRSFPSGSRNCYRINVTSGDKYLIRPTFYYGNYDGLNEMPQFDLLLGANPWTTIKLLNISLGTRRYYEIIHSPLLDYIHICLVNTGFGTPFISTIELRTLNNYTYNTQPGSLELFRRYDLGNSMTEYRYKDDVYDRIWRPYPPDKRWTQLSTSLSNDNFVQSDYKPPAVVMSTAVTPINASDSFEFYWDLNEYNVECYVYMHFYEVQKLAPNETREFNIALNGEFFFGPLVPSYQIMRTIYSKRASIVSGTRFQFSLFKTETSTLPPIINAVEIYKLMNFSKSETEQNDGLEYLHNGCKPPIIHRDVKCTNILLSENMQSKLADFGLSKSFPTDGGTHLSTVVAGTPGYLDPDYGISNRLTEKSDVYSFGVVLLKIITCQPAITQTHDNIHISRWVSSILSRGDIKKIVDTKLQGDFDTNSAWKAVEIAMACVPISSAKRPNMSDVVTELKECLAAELARKRTGRDTENDDLIEMVNVNLSAELVPLAR